MTAPTVSIPPTTAAVPDYTFGVMLRRALIVTRRELKDQMRDWRIIGPIVVLTLFFPALMNFTADQVIDFAVRNGAELVGERMVPFLMLVVGFFPISFSLVIALESFVGEKERKSIEPLLVSPMRDVELYLGKVLAATVPPLLASYLGLGVYLLGLVVTGVYTPPLILVVMVLTLTTVQALLMVAGAVVVSTQATSTRAANLLASFIIIPVSLLVQAEAVIMFWARYNTLWLIIFAEVLVLALLVRMGVQLFNREELLGREIDVLDLKQLWREFWKRLVGSARNPLQWWRHEVLGVLPKLTLPMGMVLIAIVAGLALGGWYASQYPFPTEVLDFAGLSREEFMTRFDQLQLRSVGGAGFIWFHNLRALLIATVAGMFSVGVLALVVLMLPFALIGLLLGQFVQMGLNPVVMFTGLVLPHALFEIPALVLLGGAIVRLGAAVISPPEGQPLTMGWLSALADWVKVLVGLAVPLLLLAALVEVFITPQVAAWLLFQ